MNNTQDIETDKRRMNSKNTKKFIQSHYKFFFIMYYIITNKVNMKEMSAVF